MPTRNKNQAKVREAGARLKQLRVAKRLTQQDVLMQSGGELTTTFVSRIESGAFLKPPAPDWIRYGTMLDVEPNELAKLYGYWSGAAGHAADEEPSVARLRSVLARLDEGGRAKLAHWIDFAVAQALAEQADPRYTRAAILSQQEA